MALVIKIRDLFDHAVNKNAEVVRVYLPPDANTLLSETDHCLRSRHHVNLIIAGKQPALRYLSMDAGVKHCSEGIGILGLGQQRSMKRAGCSYGVRWGRADNGNPGGSGHSSSALFRTKDPVNVVDLMTLQPQSEHPHGLSDKAFDILFTTDKPIIFCSMVIRG